MPKRAETTQSLGERVRAMREAKQIDLNTLAEKTGYEVDFLKELEEGQVSPPVGALIQISRAMAVDSRSFLGEERRAERRQSYLKRTKSYSYKCLTPDAEDKHIWAYLITLDPKKQHEMVEYKHEGEEFVYVLEGRVEIKVGQESKVIRQGGSLHFNSGIGHNLTNVSTKKSKLLVVVYAP